LESLGARTHALKYAFKLREGFRFENLRFPERILQTPTFLGPLSLPYLEQAVAAAKAEIEDAVAGLTLSS
jgi:hypothetical protein